jgi:hypothetical protein
MHLRVLKFYSAFRDYVLRRKGKAPWTQRTHYYERGWRREAKQFISKRVEIGLHGKYIGNELYVPAYTPIDQIRE